MSTTADALSKPTARRPGNGNTTPLRPTDSAVVLPHAAPIRPDVAPVRRDRTTGETRDGRRHTENGRPHAGLDQIPLHAPNRTWQRGESSCFLPSKPYKHLATP